VVAFQVTGTEKDEVADMIVSLKKLDYVDSVIVSDIQDENAAYFLQIVDPIEDEGMGEEEVEALQREVVFPITVRLRNRKGTELSDEVAAAISGVTAADISGGGETAEAITVEEVIE
jgi:hypothetical protein